MTWPHVHSSALQSHNSITIHNRPTNHPMPRTVLSLTWSCTHFALKTMCFPKSKWLTKMTLLHLNIAIWHLTSKWLTNMATFSHFPSTFLSRSQSTHRNGQQKMGFYICQLRIWRKTNKNHKITYFTFFCTCAVLHKFYQHAGWFLLRFCQNLFFNTQMSCPGVHNTNWTNNTFLHTLQIFPVNLPEFSVLFPFFLEFSTFSLVNSSEYAQFIQSMHSSYNTCTVHAHHTWLKQHMEPGPWPGWLAD